MKMVKNAVVHAVSHFIAFCAKTRCGIYSDYVSAYESEVTCRNCLRVLGRFK